MENKFDAFLRPEYLKINEARLEHLASLQLDLQGKKVLEVGAGIGTLTGFFDNYNCSILSTDAREENLIELRRRSPQYQTEVLDLDVSTDLAYLGEFDIIFCYGTLYHLAKPDQALKALSEICTEMILLETCVTPGKHMDVHLVRESAAISQAVRQVGSRPTRPWIMEKLINYWGFAYISKYQPDHEEFEKDWIIPYKSGNHRTVFVGSKKQLTNTNLLDYIPDSQPSVSDVQRMNK